MSNDRTQAIPAFIDLAAQRERLGDSVERAIAVVLEHGQYILGPEVTELERQLAAFCGARHCVSCANGTDALLLALMAESVGPGWEFYLDRLVAAETGGDVAAIDFERDYYPAMVEHYRAELAANQAPGG